jgi:phage/plasmid-associated DNA primase
VSEAVLAAVKAKRETLLLQKEEGLLVYREDFEAAQAAILSNLLLEASSLSRRIRTDIPHLTQEEADKIQARIDDVFSKLSERTFEELDE